MRNRLASLFTLLQGVVRCAHRRARTGSAPLGLLFALFLLPGLHSALAQTNAPTVTTDKSDYSPGSTVIITGSGFQPGETVQCQVLRIDIDENSGPEHVPWTTNADASGSFSTTWYVTPDELGATLQFTATGQTSGSAAQTTFSDDSNLIVSGKVQLSGGTGVSGATLVAYANSSLTSTQATTTAASDGSWSFTLAKNATFWVVVYPTGYHSTSAVAGSGGNATVIVNNELKFSSDNSGGSSTGNQFIIAANPTPTITGVSSKNITYGATSVTLTGNVSASGSVYPAQGETVTATINGHAVNQGG